MPKDKDQKAVLTEALQILANLRAKRKQFEDKADDFLKRLEYRDGAATVPEQPSAIPFTWEVLVEIKAVLEQEYQKETTDTRWADAIEYAVSVIDERLIKIKPPG